MMKNIKSIKANAIKHLNNGIQWFADEKTKLNNDVNGDNEFVNDWQDIDAKANSLNIYAIDDNHLMSDCLIDTLNGDVDSGYDMQAYFAGNIRIIHNDFNAICNLMVGGGKITDPKALYVCDSENPSDVNSVNRGNIRSVLDDMINDSKANIKAWKDASDKQVKDFVNMQETALHAVQVKSH